MTGVVRRICSTPWGAAMCCWSTGLAEGIDCGLHRVERLMLLQASRARPRRRRLPQDNGDQQIAVLPSNLLDRQFVAERSNQKWITDFTYI